MGRTTKQKARQSRPRSGWGEIQRMEEFEQKMRKYYPKRARFFYNGSHYQPSCADNFKNPNSLVPQRYKRDFFRSFYADFTEGVPEPSKIPQSLEILNVFAGSEIVLRKLIKQNKRLKHLFLGSWKDEVNAKVVKYLKYSKSLLSIKFRRALPYFSETQCKEMLRTWGKTLEMFKSHEFCTRNESDSRRAIETILMFPKLKMFQFRGQSFPFEKLRERNIAYNVEFSISAFNSSIKEFPESKPAGNVRIAIDSSDCKSEKMSLEICKFQKKSNQTLSLEFRDDNGDFKRNLLLPVFQSISSLDLIIPGYRSKFKCSSLGQLNNLKHLSAEIYDGGEKKFFGDFFKYLNKNVAPYQTLETFLISIIFEKEEEEKEQKSDAIVNFFEACSQSLKTVHFEFQYSDPKSEDPELFYQGLSKLKSIQSLSFFLHFAGFKAKEHINKLCKIISEIKSLKELNLELRAGDPQEKQLNIKLPPQLKKLSISMSISHAPFNPSKTLGPLTNLTHLELEFADFSSPTWRKVFDLISDKSKALEVFVLKKAQEDENENGISLQMKEKLDDLMKESVNLKLLVFVNMESKEIIILKRNYSWSEINPIIADLSFRQEKYMEVNYIKSYA